MKDFWLYSCYAVPTANGQFHVVVLLRMPKKCTSVYRAHAVQLLLLTYTTLLIHEVVVANAMTRHPLFCVLMQESRFYLIWLQLQIQSAVLLL